MKRERESMEARVLQMHGGMKGIERSKVRSGFSLGGGKQERIDCVSLLLQEGTVLNTLELNELGKCPLCFFIL